MTAILFLAIRILLVIALYTFLGWAVFTIWRDLKQQSNALSPAQLPKITLILLPCFGIHLKVSCEFETVTLAVNRITQQLIQLINQSLVQSPSPTR